MEEEKVTRPRRSRPLSERRETATRQVHRFLLCSTCTNFQKGEPRRLPSPTCRSCRSTSSVCDGQRPCKTCIELGSDTQKTCVRPGRKSTACDTCRSWKRCDSVKPICGSCTKADKSCIWERKLKHTHIPITRAGTVSETVAAGGSRLADSAGTEWSPDDVTTNTISKKPLESEFDHVGIVTEGEMEEKEQDAGSDDAEEEATSITQHSVRESTELINATDYAAVKCRWSE